MNIQFERPEQQALLKWAADPMKNPIILNGVRQVGKTHLMKWLGGKAYERVALFNFDEQPELCQFFERTKRVEDLIRDLSIIAGFAIDEKTLIIFDEIQSCMPALNSLKYFSEQASHLSVISAGSLLGVSFGPGHSFPVGKVSFLNVYPIRFIDYLKQSKPDLHQAIHAYVSSFEPVPDLFYSSLKNEFRTWLMIGGLPRVESRFLETLSFKEADRVLEDMNQSYIRDFGKHPVMSDIAKIGFIWTSLPSQLAKENRKFLYRLVRPGARAREYEDALLWLEKAGLTYRIQRTETPKLPLPAYDDIRAFKLYCFDIGILRKMSGLDPLAYVSADQMVTEFRGAIFENASLQALIPQLDVQPRYYAEQKGLEVDFLIQIRNQILPVEVKADENVKSRSLTMYDRTYKPSLRVRFSSRNLNIRDGLLNIPHALADFAVPFVERALSMK